MIPLSLFLGSYLVYKSIYPHPRNWYDHYIHLTRSLLAGRVDVPNLPGFYQDKVIIGNKIYLPFPPGASFLLAPFILFFKNITQQQVSIILGSLNLVLFYILFKKLTNKKNAILLSIFIGFGTSFFWASVVGTTWFFAHIVSIFFLLISLLLVFYSKKNFLIFLSGFFFAVSALTRFPVLTTGLFFVYFFRKKKRLLFSFLLGVLIFVPIVFLYNYARFGNIWEGGYTQVYESYVNGSLPYSLQRIWHPDLNHFDYFDTRSIPYHLYTFFIMPPENWKPNPYGMGILFTSPLLFLAFKPPFKKSLEKASILGIVPASLLIFTHYAQGWVQFGYRFILDFLVYLMIILALKFKPTKINIAFLVFSIVVNFWGVKWAIQLGW